MRRRPSHNDQRSPPEDHDTPARRSSGGGVRSGARKWAEKRKRGEGQRHLLVPQPGSGAVETACPTCGEPLLREWGSNCPRCRPKLAGAKSLIMSRSELDSLRGLTLGWLVVLRSAETSRRGQLIELDQERCVLSRNGGGVQGGRHIEFQDEFMSASHATLSRPALADGRAGFTLEDRRNPGPSANGTFLNARKLGPGEVAQLSDGDVIRVGTTELVFKSLLLPGRLGS